MQDVVAIASVVPAQAAGAAHAAPAAVAVHVTARDAAQVAAIGIAANAAV